jgi:sigma-B regulation protein RsbU (phosphoserine phosphatase)
MNLSQNTAKNIKSFLAYRIFFIILLLTTLPLLIYSIVLYKAEYTQKKQQIFQTNIALANQIKKNIEDNLNVKEQILDLVIDDIQYKRGNINSFLAKIVRQFDLQNLFYAQIQKNNLIITNSSDEQIINKNINFLKPLLENKITLFKNQQLMCLNCIFLAKTIYRYQNSQGLIFLSLLQDEMLDVKNLPKNIEVSIVDSYGKVIMSTNKDLSYLNSKPSNQLIVKKGIENTKYTLVLATDNKTIQLEHLKSYFTRHTLVLAIVFVVLLFATIFIIKVLAKPINALLDAMQQIKTGNIEKRYQKHKMGFEINYLGSVFNEMMDSLIIQQKEIEKEKIDKQKYLEQLKIAQDIQLSLLPEKSLKIKNLDLAFGNIYAKEVGGDFYDFIEKDDKVFFVIADIATKGVQACLYALTLRSIIRAFALEYNDLEKIIIQTNKLFLKDAQKSFMFATAFFGIYDINSKKLKYSNCGHMPAILRKNDKTLNFLNTKGKALGIEDFNKVQVNEIVLKKDELLFLYTDGIIDAIDQENKFFGEKNLHKFIQETQNRSSQEIVNSLFDKLKDYSKEIPQYDDTTIVVFKII